TQEELAAQAGLSRRGIADLELGTRTQPRKETLQLLAEALQLSPQERAQLEAASRGRVVPAVPVPEALTSSRSGLPSAVPLVGRAKELKLLGQLLVAGPPLLVVAGEPGIGKSRLLQAGLEQAEGQSWTVLSGGCHRRSGQEPYAPFIGALTDSLRRQTPAQQRVSLEGCSWLVRLLPELAETATSTQMPGWTLPPEQERRLMFKAVARYLANVAGAAGTLLVLDDLHWAGADALDLLQFLVSAPQERPLRVLVAYRDTDLEEQSPLALMVTDLARERLATRMLLAPLTEEEAVDLLDVLLPETGGEDPHLRQQVLKRAGGMPLFLVSCVQALDTGSLTHQGVSHVPWTLREAILQRVVALPEVAQRVLRLAAVVGRRWPPALLVAVVTHSDLKDEQVLEALDMCCRARLLSEVEEQEYQFAHDLFREVVLADLGTARRAVLHRRIAEALEQRPEGASVEALAHHYSRSGEVEKAIVYLERAGDAARARYAHAEAIQAYQQVVERLGTLGRGAEAAVVRLKLGKLLTILARYGEALGVFDTAEEAFRQANDLEGRLQTLAEIGLAHRWQGTPQMGLERLLAVLEPMPTLAPSPGIVACYMTLATLYLRTNQFHEQLAAAERAVALAQTLGDHQMLTAAQERRGSALLFLSRLEEACQVLTEEVLPAAEATGDAFTLHNALGTLSGVYGLWGQFLRVKECLNRALPLAEQMGDQAALLFSLLQHATIAIPLGEWKQAHAFLERATALARSVPLFAYPLVYLGQLCLAEGEEEQGFRHLDEAVQQAEQGHDLRVLRSAKKMLAEYNLLLGRPEEAQANLSPILEVPNAQLRDVDATDLLVTQAWAYIEMDKVAQAHQMLAPFLAQAREGQMRLSLAGALRVQALAYAKEERWQEAEQALMEALALFQAMPYPYAEAKTLYAFGRLYLQQGVSAQARDYLTRAQAILNTLGERLYASRIELLLSDDTNQ
ncbi:MAG TPA: AAA family ATPase, partial [Ktedonobacterales bacterium]